MLTLDAAVGHATDATVPIARSCRNLLPHQVSPPDAAAAVGPVKAAPHKVLLEQLILPNRAKAAWNSYYNEVTRFIADHMGGERAAIDIVEVGTAYGGNAASIAARFPRASVVAVDPLLAGYDPNDLHSRNLDAWASERAMSRDQFSLAWAQALAADGMARSGCRYHMLHAMSLAGAAVLASDGRRFDVAFIDGLHTYEGVASDVEAYSDLMKPGGMMIFNDYGPVSAFPGVTRAVDEFVAARGLKLVQGAEGVPPGIGNAATFLPR